MMSGALKAVVSIAALAIAALSGSHALSSAIGRSNPQLAAGLSPFATRANERLAVQGLVIDEDSGSIDLDNSVESARRAFASSGLSTEAAAILAFVQEDPVDRAASLDMVANLSLRGRVLNSMIAQSAAEVGDTETALDALDRLLTLYSNVRAQLLPVLVEFLTDEDAIPAFEQVLENDPDWANELFVKGSENPDAVRNLAQLRIRMANSLSLSPSTDRALVRRLIRSDHWPEAFALRDLLADNQGATDSSRDELAWETEFPPFDWALADQRDFHARANEDNSTVEVRIDSGQGGQLAQRLTQWPEGTRGLVIEHNLTPETSLADIQASVVCAETGESLGETAFMVSPVYVPLAGAPCDWVQITITGRAWSGRSGIRGQIGTIRFAG